MEHLPEPVLEPEDIPVPNIESDLSPYYGPEYQNCVSWIKELIREYKERVHYDEVCPGDAPPEACRPCIKVCLHQIVSDIEFLLNTAPSSHLRTEWEDLQKLEKLAKDLAKVEGNLSAWIWILIDRKCQSLVGTRLAKQMLMRPRGDDNWGFGKILRVSGVLADYWMNRKQVQRWAKAALNPMEHFQNMTDMLVTEIATMNLPAADVPGLLREILNVDVQLVTDSEDGKAKEENNGRPVADDLASLTLEENDIQPCSPDFNQLWEATATNKEPVEDALSTSRRTTGIEFDIMEREPSEIRASVAPGPQPITGYWYTPPVARHW
ncbi:MAG: hypothetical protein LQ337_007139 [Flavoplaca oasis]|nr:MAG: hypothetical protein LQ337_007139 [Flavoplaca oasis]